ncbi:hypothetical protein LguiB_006709 [Lonicera macranthoides]
MVAEEERERERDGFDIDEEEKERWMVMGKIEKEMEEAEESAPAKGGGRRWRLMSEMVIDLCPDTPPWGTKKKK